MKALVVFAFVCAGQTETFADFDRGKGFPILVEALRDIVAYDVARASEDEKKESKHVAKEKEETLSVAEKDAKVCNAAAPSKTTCSNGEEKVVIDGSSESDASAQKLLGTGEKRKLDTAADDTVVAKKLCVD
jgi:hypothetical protein